MEEARSFGPLSIVIFLAFANPLSLSRFRRLRLPFVVGEIQAEILVPLLLLIAIAVKFVPALLFHLIIDVVPVG